jgi:phage/plasmid-like protein (TIGR03299 family)
MALQISTEPVVPTREQIAAGVAAQLIADPAEYSREGASTLARNVVVGMTDRYGFPWWAGAWRPEFGEAPFYAHGIPVEVVRRRCFDWSVVERELADVDEYVVFEEEGRPDRREALSFKGVPGWKSLRRSDTGEVLHVVKSGHRVHEYGEILLDGLSSIIQDTLYISSAGTLKGGRVGWVQVETDALEHQSGVTIRPHALISTSHDQSYATSARENATNVCCDNSHRRALGEDVPVWRMRHTSGSQLNDAQITKARQALGLMIEREADAWQIELDLLTRQPVTGHEYEAFVNLVAPLVDDKGATLEGRSRTMALGKQDELHQLWRRDQRVAPWSGTAWGVVQAFNTWSTHVQTARGTTRLERQMLRALDGDTGDREALRVLDTVKHGAISDLAGDAIRQQRAAFVTSGR